jgi:hypothetical protein
MNTVYVLTSRYGEKVGVRAPFEYKDYLKSLGGRWNPETHAWLIPASLRSEASTYFRRRGFTVEDDRSTPSRSRNAAHETWAEAMFAAIPDHLHEATYRALCLVLHPDIGGDPRAAQVLIDARTDRERRVS